MDHLDRLAHAIQLFLGFRANPRPREAWLQANEGYRDLLEALLAEADGAAGEELPREEAGAPPGDGVVRIRRSPTTGAVESLGPYRVIDVLGEGGMGTVYLAEQSEPIRRRVALKVIRLGMETRDVIARFEAERQALARMNHPNIARVLEAGTTSDRCPYFVMELVAGDRMTWYCDENKLGLRDRIALFAEVCDGVQHAHQRGIIHRDLKPSNVLVSVIDGRATPKIIDFGVAKAIGQDLEDRSLLYTRTGGILGTPAFMSPEQLDPEEEPVDTRTDVYSLGVLLHELLVGELPFDLESDSRRGLAELCRVVRNVDPQRPSTRIGRLGDAAMATAAARSVNVRTLQRGLRGELDWIVLRCLEKDRARRYQSASELAEDLRRYLAHEPVLARPPGSLYRARKLIRKNRGVVTACAIVLISLVAGLGWALVEKSRADQKAAELTVQVYRAKLLMTASALDAGQLNSARQFLEDAPAELRGWEWRHLVSRLQPGLRRFDSVDGLIHDLAAVPGGRSFVSARDGSILQRDLKSGAVLRTIPVPGIPRACSVDASGELLAVLGVEDGTETARSWAGTWRLGDGERLGVHWLDPSLAPQLAGDVSAESRRAIISGPFGLALFDLARKEVIARRELGKQPWRTSFSPSGRQIVLDEFGNLDRMEIVDGTTLELIRRLSGHIELRDRAFSPDETRLAIVAQDGTMKVWDLSDAAVSEHVVAPVISRSTNQDRPLRVVYSDDGTHLITSGLDRSVAIWNASTGDFVDRFPLQQEVKYLVAVPGSREFISIDTSGGFRSWAIDRRELAVLRGHESFVYSVSIDRDRGLILTGGWDGFAGKPGAFRLWDLESGDPVAAWGDPNVWCTEAMFLPGQNAFLTLGTTRPTGPDPYRQRITRIDLVGGSSRVLADFRCHVVSWYASRTQPRVWLITNLGELHVLNTETGELDNFGARWHSGLTSHLFQVALTPDERTMVITSGGTGFFVCRTSDLETLRELPVLGGHAMSISFDAEGRRLLTCHENGIVYVWDVRSGRELGRLIGHDLGVLSARFNPDGTRIATGGRDRIVRIWSGETYEHLASLTGHERYVYEVEWQDDGERLFSASGDGTVRVWETDPTRTRYEAGRERQALVEKLTPAIDAWLAEHGDPAAAEGFLEHAGLSARERQVARQILLGRWLGHAPE